MVYNQGMTIAKNILADCPLLSGFPPEALDELAAIGRIRAFNANEQIYEQGAMNTTLCVIAEGVVRISSINAEGREATLIMFSAGAWFGDAVFSPGVPRVYGATAHEPVKLVELPGEEFRALMGRYPQSYPVALDMVSRRLWAAMSIIEDDALRNIPTRIGRRLLFLAQIQGTGEAGKDPVTLWITREHMANMMGMTRQGVHKWIKAFEAEGLVELGYGRMTLTNPAALQAFLGRADLG
ncbi:Crp/Fnr family transcriptional regulator [Marinobacter sp. CHS3-4]|uniref:Crp/Fnr family transcriptional regulator n=1 Tax=Marinobacter sp. CHS3-4 TaxID=3045174 RepID=UPI0024B60B3A|nr:Crp/Fnr family transcriptional regulator [Marinobacter sp. CHS3-4]MDI9244515.1 Crp/Fnr family transcriptional regulator [Marinobacter sp. CHS3-4]